MPFSKRRRVTNPLYTHDPPLFLPVPAHPAHSPPRTVITLDRLPDRRLQPNLEQRQISTGLPPETIPTTRLRPTPRRKLVLLALILRRVLRGVIPLPPAPVIFLNRRIRITRPRPPLLHQPFDAQQQIVHPCRPSAIRSTLGRRVSPLSAMESLWIMGMDCLAFAGELKGARSG